MITMSPITIIGIKLIKISAVNPTQLEISDNAGISWHLQFKGSLELGNFFHLGKRNLTVFARTSEGNFRSVTEGRTWTKVQ